MQQTGHKDRDMIFLRAYDIDEVVNGYTVEWCLQYAD